MTVNSFSSVSLDPLLVLVSLARRSRTLEVLNAADRFAVSVLRREQESVALSFAAPGGEFPFERVRRTDDGFLIVRDALAYLLCQADAIVPAGDHDVAFGRVVDFALDIGQPLVFYAGRFGVVTPDAKEPIDAVLLGEGFGW
jgi:flavin reductase (DIM6/NTAB) family NADH-FMN oxidoreductase RutF